MKTANRNAAMVTLVMVVASGCSSVARSGTAPAAAFDAQGGGRVPCLVHQTHMPTPIFEPGTQRTGAVLVVLHYYTANGTDRYCDGHSPTVIDGAWVRLYEVMGADPANLAPGLR